MKAKDKQDRKSAPLPWTVGDELQDLAAMDADGWCVFRVASRFYDGEPRGEDARRLTERIVLAVNERDKMHRIAVELAKSRDAAVADAERLRGLVRRFMGIINNLPPAVSGVALMEAEVEDAGKLEMADLVSQGYKRIAELMKDAYAAVGDDDREDG